MASRIDKFSNKDSLIELELHEDVTGTRSERVFVVNRDGSRVEVDPETISKQQQRIAALESALANAWSALVVLSASSRVEVATAGFVAQSILTDALGHERLRELIVAGDLDGYEQWQKEYRKRISEDSD